MTDANAEVVQTYRTDEFGVPTNTEGSSTQPFQAMGEQRDAQANLYDLRARYYDPAIGRFMSQDPLVMASGDFNLYTYVGNNPCSWVDPSGLTKQESGGHQRDQWGGH